ncbi:MAG: dehydrogenase E1 component subunit alpha/beta [Sumerlaeia bacterium]
MLKAQTQAPAHSITSAEALALYRTMVTSRCLDDAEITLKKRNQAYFQISSAGHEAIQTALAHVLDPTRDWFFLYYRDRAFALHLGTTPLDMLLQAVGAADDPASAGRQMPCHFSMPDKNLVTVSSVTGSRCNHAVGAAEAGRIWKKLAAGANHFQDGEVVLMTLGDGTTHQGEFQEAIWSACIQNLPLLTVVEDNGYAISTPVEDNVPGGDIARAMQGMPNLTTLTIDGTDVIGCVEQLRALVAKMRSGIYGPVLVRATTVRPYSHSLSDDQRNYRVAQEIAEEASRCPLLVAERRLLESGLVTAEELQEARREVEREVRHAMSAAVEAPKPDPDTATDHLYATENSPLDEELYGKHLPIEEPGAEPIPLAKAINQTLHDEMERDERIVVFGQDVADASREEALATCNGKGGVFKVTAGLTKRFGKHRCFNGSLAEANIVGRAIGMAARGLRPVVEVQFFDYIWTAMQQLRLEMATMRYRSGGAWTAPVVVRVPIGGYLRGGSIYHSQTGEGIFTQCPGLRIAYPSNAQDAAGLLRTAIRCDDPVLFLEPKHLYYQTYNRTPYPGAEYTLPFGKAATRRQGRDITIVTWGALVQKSLEAAERLAREDGYEAEVIDIRTLNPLDEDTIFESVRRTHRVVIACEEGLTGGFAGEIAALISEHCFEWLDAPIRRVASLPCWVAYSPVLEDRILPQTDDVFTSIRDLVRY